MRQDFSDSNKQLIMVIIFIAFISISIYFLIVSDSGIKSDSKKTSNNKSDISNVAISNSNVQSSNKVSNSNVKGSKPVKIVTSNKTKTSNTSGNNTSSVTNNSGISYFTTEVSTNKIYVGNTTNIKVNIVPSTVKTNITYSSENPYVARVSANGVITGVSPGVCNINISVEGGGQASFQIQVLSNPTITSNNNSKSNVVSNMISSVQSNQVITSNKSNNTTSNKVSNTTSNSTKVSVQSISITNHSQTMTVGETVKLNAVISPSNATNKGITWKSNDPSIATVDSNGVVTAKKQGTTLIVATTIDGSKRANAGITVKSKKTFTATFKMNGSNSISKSTASCITSNGSDTCTVTTPTITRSGYTILGWSTASNATSATIKTNQQITLNGNKTYYAITKKTVTAKFVFGNNSTTNKSCTIYNTSTQCKITPPTYDDQNGKYGNTWSKTKGGYTQAVANNPTSINSNVTYYAIYRHPWRYNSQATTNARKDRNLSIQKAYNLGPTKVVYEKGIPQNAMINHYNFLVALYYKMPYLFSPGKIWVMTESTYAKQSTAYGLTTYWGPFFNVDLKYDTANKIISPGATVHELGHAWDGRFEFMHSSKKRIKDQSDMVSFYNSLGASGRNNLSDVEWFAATVHDYYFRVLAPDKKEDTPSGYDKYSASNKTKIKNLMNKYANISKNGYK